MRLDESEKTVRMLLDMLTAKYTIAHIQDAGVDRMTPHFLPYPKDLPEMKEVTALNVKYDLADVLKFRVRRCC